MIDSTSVIEFFLPCAYDYDPITPHTSANSMPQTMNTSGLRDPGLLQVMPGTPSNFKPACAKAPAGRLQTTNYKLQTSNFQLTCRHFKAPINGETHPTQRHPGFWARDHGKASVHLRRYPRNVPAIRIPAAGNAGDGKPGHPSWEIWRGRRQADIQDPKQWNS